MVPALDPIEHAYTLYLGMRVAARGSIDPAQAQAWSAPACAGCRTLTLVPEIGQATSLRFIEDAAAGTCPPFTTHGWNATEITVRDTDALAANLKGFEWIRAMQVLGPAGECLYLTDVGADATLAQASGPVGQIFIVVVGGADIDAIAGFYGAHFPNEISAAVEVPIGVINRANGLPPEARHKLAILKLPGGTRIELDQYPPCTGPRPVVPGHLPAGMAIVSFAVDPVPATSILRGAAGEIVELQAS